jgi:hypothetical protein
MEKAFAINNKKKSKKPVPRRRNTFHIVRRTIPRWGGSLQTAQRPWFHMRGSAVNAFCMWTSGRRSLQGAGRCSSRPQPINTKRTWTARKPHSRPGQPPRNASPFGRGRQPRGVVSGEFATGNGLASITAPMTSSLFPAGANLTSIGEVVLWGYVCNPMRLSRRVGGTHAMVATLKRPPHGLPPSVPALPCLTSLGALTPPVGSVAALREYLPAPRNDSFLMSFTIVDRG